jgi:hypothetical protein
MFGLSAQENERKTATKVSGNPGFTTCGGVITGKKPLQNSE